MRTPFGRRTVMNAQLEGGGTSPLAAPQTTPLMHRDARASGARPKNHSKHTTATAKQMSSPPGHGMQNGSTHGSTPASANDQAESMYSDIEQEFFRGRMSRMYTATAIAWMFAPLPYMMLLPGSHVCGTTMADPDADDLSLRSPLCLGPLLPLEETPASCSFPERGLHPGPFAGPLN